MRKPLDSTIVTIFMDSELRESFMSNSVAAEDILVKKFFFDYSLKYFPGTRVIGQLASFTSD